MTNFRLNALEDQMRDPLSIANVDSLLDTVTALVADCDHESIKRLKNIEAYAGRCKLIKKKLLTSVNTFMVDIQDGLGLVRIVDIVLH